MTPHFAQVLDGTKFPPVDPTPLFLAEFAAAATAAGDDVSKGEPIKDARPIGGLNLKTNYVRITFCI